ncbi:MAG: VOC family protein [Treponema sp.]|nr:VOC family protein [Treponema sp.]
MITGIAHIAVNAKDMEKSMDFYVKVLGFKKAFSLAHPETGAPWIEYLQAGNQFIELFYNAKEENPWRSSLCGFNHLCLRVDDIHSAVKMIKEAGYPMDKEVSEGKDRNLQAWLKDPDGIRIELMQINPQSPQGKCMGL